MDDVQSPYVILTERHSMAQPERIGKYVIDSVLGRGGMGEVYKAHDESLGRFVALKIMRGPSLDDEVARERFVREAQAAGGLRHPNIVTVYDLGEVEGQLYIAMEYIKGDDLEHIIKSRRPLMLEDKLNIMIQVSEGVSYAHKNQIVHRDLKPSNIRIDDEGVVKIMDFGIAKMESSNMTASGTVMGTPYYMSPEQVRGMRVDTRSDIFSLGAILYEVFTYQKAFPGEMASVFYKIIHEAPTPLSEHMDVQTAPLQSIVDLCLAKDKNARMQTASDLADMLRDAQRGYREINSATVIGIRAQEGQQPDAQFHIAPAPTAVNSASRSRSGIMTQLTPTGAPATVMPNKSMPSIMNPSTHVDPTQLLPQPGAPPVPPAYAPPGTQPQAASSGGGLKIAMLAVVLLLFVGGGAAGVYYYVTHKSQIGSDAQNQKIAEAKALFNAEKYEQAENIYSALLKDDPNNANLHFLNGAAKNKLLKKQEALLELQTAVELDPKMERAWQQLGFVLSDRMDYKNAESAFQRAVAINPDSGASWQGLGQVYVNKGEWNKAEEAFRRTIQLEPQNIDVQYNLGVMLLQQKHDYDGARKIFEAVISLNPSHAEAHNNLGVIYLHQGDVARSVQENETALQLKPDLFPSHYSLFVAYQQQGNNQLAAEHLEKYMQLSGKKDPDLVQRLEELRQ